MEAGRFSELPGWTYAIGWVAAYPESMGLDPEPIILNLEKNFSGCKPTFTKAIAIDWQ